MTRWGIGPKFGTITLVYALAAAYMTHRRPDLFGIAIVSDTFLLVAGALLICWGTWVYIRALRVLNRALSEGQMATTGPFAHVRHPIYASWLLLLLPGGALMCRSWLVLTATAVGYASFRVLIPREEAAVEAKYGEDYRKYTATHNRLLPALWGKWPGMPEATSEDL